MTTRRRGHEYCLEASSPVRRIEPLPPEEVARPEHAAEHPEHREMLFSLKLVLYCGIRPMEVTSVVPKRNIVDDELIIRPNASKTGRERVVPL